MIMNKMVVIVDYNMGNVASVYKAFTKLGTQVIISDKEIDILNATHIVLPGVGAFGDGITNLKNKQLVPTIVHKVKKLKTPFLGICLGMQLLAQKSYEFGVHE